MLGALAVGGGLPVTTVDDTVLESAANDIEGISIIKDIIKSNVFVFMEHLFLSFFNTIYKKLLGSIFFM
jgi:hypothetical protein